MAVMQIVKTEEIDVRDYEPPPTRLRLWDKIFNEKLIEFEYLVTAWFARKEIEEEELDDFLLHEESYIRQQLKLYEEDNEDE